MNMYCVEYNGGYFDVFANDADEAWEKVAALGWDVYNVIRYG